MKSDPHFEKILKAVYKDDVLSDEALGKLYEFYRYAMREGFQVGIHNAQDTSAKRHIDTIVGIVEDEPAPREARLPLGRILDKISEYRDKHGV